MSKILDGLTAVSVICDMVESFRNRGINIKIDDLNAEMAARDAARNKVNDKLGIG